MINEKYLGHFLIDRPTYLIRRTNYTWDGMMQLYNFVVQTCCFRCLFHLNQNILARNNIFPWMIIEHWSNPLTFNFAEKILKLSLIDAMQKCLSRKIKSAITENQIKIEIHQLKKMSNAGFVWSLEFTFDKNWGK